MTDTEWFRDNLAAPGSVWLIYNQLLYGYVEKK